MRGADLVVHAGDFTAVEILAGLEALGPPLVAVHGNVDSAAVIERLPERTEVEIEDARLAVIHDAGPRRGRLARMRRAFPDADAVVFGHSHMAAHERDGRFQIFNPGSPTERRRSPHRSMGLAFVEDGRISFEHVILD